MNGLLKNTRRIILKCQNKVGYIVARLQCHEYKYTTCSSGDAENAKECENAYCCPIHFSALQFAASQILDSEMGLAELV